MKTAKYSVPEDKSLKLGARSTDDTGSLTREEAEVQTAALQVQLAGWQEKLYAEGQQSLLVVLQARDAGGKDGTIKHVFAALNPQSVHISSFKVPTPEEQGHDFLWRVHQRAPAAGTIGVFNRSHYEDVIVTRVHGLIDKAETKRRLGHIRNFEELLSDRGTRIIKFYLHVSKGEQKQRLQDRLEDPDKLWKFNVSDLEERELWDEYTKAFEHALPATSSEKSPWYVIPADHKWFRNYLISKVMVETLEEMNPKFPPAAFDPKDIVIK